jgi:hypothetical protein
MARSTASPFATDDSLPAGVFMQLVRRNRHECPTPMTGRQISLRPSVPTGTVWRCPCGRLWEVEIPPQPIRGQVFADPRQWRHARLVTRWRYRRGQLLEFTPPGPRRDDCGTAAS